MLITDPFVTDHVDNGPLLNVYCSVDAKSPKHFVKHTLPRPALGTNRVCYECGLLCTGLLWTGLLWT